MQKLFRNKVSKIESDHLIMLLTSSCTDFEDRELAADIKQSGIIKLTLKINPEIKEPHNLTYDWRCLSYCFNTCQE